MDATLIVSIKLASPRGFDSMLEQADNPYAVLESHPFDAKKGEFVVQGNRIICGKLLKLPKICLQTGVTEDLVETGSMIFVRPPWLWKLQLAAGVTLVVAIALVFYLIFHLDMATISSRFGKFLIFGPGCLTLLLLMVLSPAPWLVPTVRLNGYMSKKHRRTWMTSLLLTSLTSLPFFVVLIGFTRSSPWSLTMVMSFESWWPIAIIVGAIASGKLLRRLLEWHWRSTRTRGIDFKGEQLSDGLFAIHGFSPEFLRQLLPQNKD